MKKILLVAVLTLFTFALKAQQYHNGHQYVDLGLSVKWATCNVGADSPEEYGNYYAWGETSPKTNYTWDTYKWCNGSFNTLTKYCTEYDCGKVDNKTTLELKDDAAYVNWGGKWRMPTEAEWNELLSRCKWMWTSRNGINGYLAMSRENGSCIFFPAAGGYNTDFLIGAGVSICYWSSSILAENTNDACCYTFISTEDVKEIIHSGGYCYRFIGFTIRPVCE